MAMNMGYLNTPSGSVVSMDHARQLPLDELVVLATGAQGEPTSALVRIANGEHQDILITPGDTVVLSASPIPGNETVVAKTIDNLYRQGARVLYSRTALVHVHGHGSREELKMMLSLVKPKFFLPVHGEYRHLVAHASIAQSTGIPASNTFVLEDGDLLELGTESGEVVERVPAGHVYVDGRSQMSSYSEVFEERRRLARDGIVVVISARETSTDGLLKPPKIASFGFVEPEGWGDLLERTSEKAHTTLELHSTGGLEWERVRAEVADSVSKFLYDETRRRPKVLVHIEEV
jgi:ribonuclease J